MAKCGTLQGIIDSAITNVLTNASLADVDAKLKEIGKANDAVSKRWAELMSSPEATNYKAKREINDHDQTQLIIDLENLIGKIYLVCVAQQNALHAVNGTLKNLNRK